MKDRSWKEAATLAVMKPHPRAADLPLRFNEVTMLKHDLAHPAG
ncbi:MAG: hypothetical protein VX815_00285 [Gemmatimonadota bacterium]|nr:hypothetical protein [Gemmatimonadota bacterium]